VRVRVCMYAFVWVRVFTCACVCGCEGVGLCIFWCVCLQMIRCVFVYWLCVCE